MLSRARLAPLALALAVTSMNAGCGGGSGSNRPSNVLSVPIDWPERSRGVQATESSESVLVILTIPQGGDQAYSAFSNRGSGSAAHSTVATSLKSVPAGIYRLQAEFHAAPEGQGAVVATASSMVQVRQDGTIVGPSGAPLPSIAAQSKIVNVSLPSGEILETGQILSPAIQAFGEGYQLVAVSPKAGTFNVVSGGEHVAVQNGNLRGVSLGEALITVTLDGVTSDAARFSVVRPGTEIRTVSVNANGLVGSPGSSTLYATVNSSDNRYPNSIVVIDGATGGVVHQVPVGSTPQAPAISKDGTRLYVLASGSQTVVEYSLPALGKVREFEVGRDEWGAPLPGVDIAVSPVDPQLVAVSTAWIGKGIQLFRSGERLGHVEDTNDQGMISLVFNDDGTSVFGSWSGSPGSVVRDDVDDTGISAVTMVREGGGFPLIYVSGRLYAGTNVLDPQTLSLVGTMPTLDWHVAGLAVDGPGRRAWLLDRYAIVAVDTDTLTRVASYPMSIDNLGSLRLTRVGERGIALIRSSLGSSGTNQILILNNAPGL